MTKVDIADGNSHISRDSASVESGRTVPVRGRNAAIAESRPELDPPLQPRPVAIDCGIAVPSSFFEPLPDELLDAFEGGKKPV